MHRIGNVMPSAADPAPTVWGPATTRPPRPSATLVLVREGAEGPEVLLVRRADRGDQNSNRWVFPGGLIDASDSAARDCCHGPDDAQASAQLGVAEGGLDIMIAALRETLEETGLLLAVDADGQRLGEAAAAMLAHWRDRCRSRPPGQGGAALAGLCRQHGWRLAVDGIRQISHWITPLGMPKRFDTRFLLARAPVGQTVSVDGIEIVDHCWAGPAALVQDDAGIKLFGPARAIVQELAGHTSVAAIEAWSGALGPIEAIRPRLGSNAQGLIGPVLPCHPAYAEIGFIDPDGHGHACQAIRPGVPVRLAPGLIRITAPNGGVMTGPGTNSYLLDCGSDRDGTSTWALIDPGPDDPMHLHPVLEHLPGRLVAILATHTHVDHSSAARRLKAMSGAPIYGREADHRAGQDPDFRPDIGLRGGERLQLGADLALRVIHTPGHASNHLCFLDEPRRLLFTGDHVMQGSTVVINPPDGDMAAYLDSLQRLAERAGAVGGFDWIAPGHGFLMDGPAGVLKALIEHRRRREEKVMTALRAAATDAPASLDALLAQLYDDVSAHRHALAARSLLAHLVHLQAQGRVHCKDDRWTAA